MRGLIVLQPWAGLHAAGLKVNAVGASIEFRNRETRIREEVAIYAGHCIPCRSCLWADEKPPLGEPVCGCADVRAESEYEYSAGKVLCLATLADCRPVSEQDRSVPGCPADLSGWAWVFTDLRPLARPVPCKPPRGAQVWFTLTPEDEARVWRSSLPVCCGAGAAGDSLRRRPRARAGDGRGSRPIG